MKTINFIIWFLIILFAFSSFVFAEYESENVSLIGRWPYGTCRTAFADDNYAYISNGTVMEVLDVSNPNLPIKVGELITESRVNCINISNGYAYIANWSDGFRIIDISTPSEPTEVAAIEFDWQCWNVSVFGNYAYVGNDTLGLRIINISDPTSPELIGTFCPPGTIGAEYTQVIDTLAYLATKDGLYIVNISDPSLPVQISYSPSSTGSYHVHVVNNIAYLPEFDDGIRIVDVSNPYSPIEIGYFDTPSSAAWIESQGNYAYIADSESGLYVIDISNPTSPDSIFVLNTEFAYAFNIQDDYIYLADDVCFKIIDISNPISPTLNGFYLTGGSQLDVYVSNNYAYVADGYRGLGIFEITDPASPIEVGNCDTENVIGVYVSENYAYMIDNGDLRIFNITDPEDPIEVSVWEDGNFYTVYVSGIYAYLGGYPDLCIINVYDPGNPYEVGVLDDLPGSPLGIYVAPGYIYLANRWGGLRIIDVSNPTDPFEVGSFPINYAYRIFVLGSYAYVADRFDGFLRVIDISDPYAPFEVSSVSVYDQIMDVYGSGDFVYALSNWSGVRVFDVIGPTNPIEVGFFDTGGYSRGVYAIDNYIM